MMASAARIAPQPPLNPASYEAETYQKGLGYERSPFTFDTTKWEGLAKKRLSAEAFSYVGGNAGREETTQKNAEAIRKWSIVPTRMTGTELPAMNVKVFGEDVPFPMALAPVGVQALFHAEAESAAAKAAEAQQVPYILSSATATPIEDVAKFNGNGQRWFQLYWPGTQYNHITASLLRRAKASGYTVLFVTLDTYLLGWRPGDMDNGYNPFLKSDMIGVANGLSDPVFQKHFKDLTGKSVQEDLGKAAAEWVHVAFPGKNHAWEDLEFLKQHWDGPIVLKGIQTVADAKTAVRAGVQGIVVSNHGGRQQDGGVGSLDMLPAIVDAVGDKIDVAFDSGIRNGSVGPKGTRCHFSLYAKAYCLSRTS